MEKNNNIMKGQGEDGKWITVNGTHILVGKGQSVEEAVNTKFDKKAPAKKNETSDEVLSVSKALNKTGKATTQSKEVADMYKKNTNPHWNFTVKETPNGYEISTEKNQEPNVNDITEKNIDKVISDLPVGGEITIQLTGGHNEDLNTLHIQRKSKDYFKLWNSNANGLLANENNYSSLSNTIFWAKQDFNKVESIK